MATALNAHGVFESKDNGQSWQRTPDTGVSIRAAMDFQGRLLAASSYNGLLLQQGGGGVAASETANVAAGSNAVHSSVVVSSIGKYQGSLDYGFPFLTLQTLA